MGARSKKANNSDPCLESKISACVIINLVYHTACKIFTSLFTSSFSLAIVLVDRSKYSYSLVVLVTERLE